MNITYNIMARLKMKVWVNKGNNQKLITVPKCCDIKDGDYVWIDKVEK